MVVFINWSREFVMKKISIFGATGTIGKKAGEIAALNNFEIIAITGNSNHEELIRQAKLYNPKYVCVTDNDGYKIVRDSLSGFETEVLDGSELKSIANLEVDVCVMAISGVSGLAPTFECLGRAKRLAIATKEAIICGGDLLINEAKVKNTEIIPVDSEHSSLFQCLAHENKNDINKLIITASGGPFLNLEESELANVSLAETLRHPNWTMGKKITVDSATMINKALEIIEASYLFDIPINKIEPLIHPESIIHGMAFFNDGSFKASLSAPDMFLPISYAINYPDRKPCFMKGLDFSELGQLSFQKPKSWQKRNMNLAYESRQESKVIAFNIANEYAVDLFLREKIKFTDIYTTIMKTIEKSPNEQTKSLGDIVNIISDIKNQLLTIY